MWHLSFQPANNFDSETETSFEFDGEDEKQRLRDGGRWSDQ